MTQEWNDLLWLLRARPDEFAPGDRFAARLRSAAATWVGRTELRPEEAERIRLVWIEGTYRAGLGLGNERSNALRSLR